MSYVQDWLLQNNTDPYVYVRFGEVMIVPPLYVKITVQTSPEFSEEGAPKQKWH
jgi:hypothetical protein